MIRVALAHPVRVYLDAITQTIDRTPGMCTVTSTDSIEKLRRSLASRNPDVILVQGGEDDALIAPCMERAQSSLVALPAFGPYDPEQLNRRGFADCVEESACLAEHVRAILAAFAVARPANGGIAARTALVGPGLPSPNRAPSVMLTERETEVAHLLADGLTNAEIGAELGIQESTVKNHVHRVLEKLGIDRRYRVRTVLDRIGRGEF